MLWLFQRSWRCVSNRKLCWLPWQGRGIEREGGRRQKWIKLRCEWEWAKLSFKCAISVLECCAGISISISAFSYDSLSCLTSVDCHVKGLILASLRQPNIPLAHSYPEVCNFCSDEVAGKPNFPVYWEWADISNDFESCRHQSMFCGVPGGDCVYTASVSEPVLITNDYFRISLTFTHSLEHICCFCFLSRLDLTIVGFFFFFRF